MVLIYDFFILQKCRRKEFQLFLTREKFVTSSFEVIPLKGLSEFLIRSFLMGIHGYYIIGTHCPDLNGLHTTDAFQLFGKYTCKQ